MKYDKPTIHLMRGIQKLVLGTKHSLPFLETPVGQFMQSVKAYEDDE
jgi:hypothetical protein